MREGKNIKNKNKENNKKSEENKDNIKIKGERSPDHDEISKRIKTSFFTSIIGIINSFDDLRDNQIKPLDKEIIYNESNSLFNLLLFNQRIFSIFGNKSNLADNEEIIRRIIDEYNKNKEHCSLIEFLNLTMQYCFDIFLYMKEDPKNYFKTKIDECLFKIYQELHYFDEEEEKKDYIASFVILAYNLPRYFLVKPTRISKKDIK